ncbi:MAG: acyl-CoA dehydrogenase family protein [Chloroflexi bacterium]|nr:acyl-CoA dehydrogenase family protein [Chloroflexota bacterium]
MDFQLSPEEQALKERVRKLVDEQLSPIAAEVDESHDVRWDVVKMMGDAGLYRIVVPKEYGGDGLWVMGICLVREELNRVSSHADSLFAMQGLGTTPITFGGSEELKKRYLPPVARGEQVAAFALTEPDAGSDAASMCTSARLVGDEYVINGKKRFISNCGAAATYVTFLKTDDSAGTRGISAVLVEKGAPGLSFDTSMRLLAAHPIGEVIYNDCLVPRSQLLGEEGQGFKLAMRTLDVYRSSVGAAALGLAQGAFEEALSYAKRRVQFGQPLARNQAIQFKLADMATEISASRFLVYHAAWRRDQNIPQTKESSIAKLYATETAGRVVDHAVQIHGGFGLTKLAKVERLYREERAMRIYEGTSEVQHIVIASHLLKE